MNYPYHLDFSQRLVMKTSQMDWTPSPVAGVDRIMLERESSESGRASSLGVMPQKYFSANTLIRVEKKFWFAVVSSVMSTDVIREVHGYEVLIYLSITLTWSKRPSFL